MSYKPDYNKPYFLEWYQRNKEKQKESVKKRSILHRARNREFVKSYLLNHPCVDCGFSDTRALDFDHVRGTKRKVICRMVTNGCSIKTIQIEIDKCEVRCSNCHRIRTRQREQASITQPD